MEDVRSLVCTTRCPRSTPRDRPLAVRDSDRGERREREWSRDSDESRSPASVIDLGEYTHTNLVLHMTASVLIDHIGLGELGSWDQTASRQFTHRASLQ